MGLVACVRGKVINLHVFVGKPLKMRLPLRSERTWKKISKNRSQTNKV